MKSIPILTIVVCALLIVGCPKQTSPLLRIEERVYDHGWKICGELVVGKDKSYSYVLDMNWNPRLAKFSRTHTGIVPDNLFSSLQELLAESDSFETFHNFAIYDDVPVYAIAIEDHMTKHPESISKVVEFVHNEFKSATSAKKEQ